MAVYRLRTPVEAGEVEKLKLGDLVYVDGVVHTARDQAHRRALEWAGEGRPVPFNLEGGVVYHCGPIVRRVGEGWELVAAGPTTSSRMEPLERDFIAFFRPRVVVGKGGMGKKTAEACREFKAVVCDMTGGAAVVAARAVKRILSVEWLDLGMAEAVWVFEVENFGPMTVVIDTEGRSLHEEVESQAWERWRSLLKASKP